MVLVVKDAEKFQDLQLDRKNGIEPAYIQACIKDRRKYLTYPKRMNQKGQILPYSVLVFFTPSLDGRIPLTLGKAIYSDYSFIINLL